MKTLQNHFVRSALFLLFALLCPILVQAQGMPKLNPRDFSVTLVSGNTNCNTYGGVILNYRNAVPGIQTLRYELQVKYSNNKGYVTQDVPSGVPTYIELADWFNGQPIAIKVTGFGTGGEHTETVDIVKNFEQPWDESPGGQDTYTENSITNTDMFITTEPASGCDGTKGKITMGLTMTGFSKVEWRLYQGAALINTLTSTTPNMPESFSNLSTGKYRVEARATPACVTLHPSLTAPGATWDGDVIVLTKDVEITPFQINKEEISGAIGNCGSSYNCQLSGLSGVTSMTAEVLPKGGTTVLKTTTTDAGKDFKIGFKDLPTGDYTLRLTADNCNVVMLKDFSVKNVELQLSVRYDGSPLYQNPCGKVTITCETNNPYPNDSHTFRLIHVASGEVVATKTWQYSESEPQCRFSNLALKPQEKYAVEADFCGGTKRSYEFEAYAYPPRVILGALADATGVCTGEGGKLKVNVTNAQGLPLRLAGTVEIISPDGITLASQSMPVGWSGEVVFNDIPADDSYTSYAARFILECNGLVSISDNRYNPVRIPLTGKTFDLSVRSLVKMNQCIPDYVIEFKPDGSEIAKFLDTDFEIKKEDGTSVWKGKYVPDYSNLGFMRVSVPAAGNYLVIARPSCGIYTKKKNVTVSELTQASFWNPAYAQIRVTKSPLPCYDNGEVDISGMNPRTSGNGGAYIGLSPDECLWTLEKDGLPYRNGKFGSVLQNLPPGNYKFTSYLQCNPTIKLEKTFELKSELTVTDFSTSGACGTKVLGKTSMSFSSFNKIYEGYPYHLYNADSGVLYKEGKLESYNNKFEDKLPSGNYRMVITTPTLLCGGIPDYTYNFTVPNDLQNYLLLGSDKLSYGIQPDLVPIKMTHASYLANNGTITVGVYKNPMNAWMYSFSEETFPVLITVRSAHGSFNKTLSVNGVEKNVKFENLPADTYIVSATIDGNSCIPERSVRIESLQGEDWTASAHLSPRCNERNPHASFRVSGTHSSLSTVVYTFKTYVWDDVASDYVLSHSLTGTPGQLTAMVDVTEYTGSSAPRILNDNYSPRAPYKFTIETNGKEVYSTLALYYQGVYVPTPWVTTSKTDGTPAHPLGSITAKLSLQNPYNNGNPSSPMLTPPISLRDNLLWTLTSTDGNYSQKKKTDCFSPVLFDKLPSGYYQLDCYIQKKGCPLDFLNSTQIQVLAPSHPTVRLRIQATGVDGKCLDDCKIKVKVLENPTAFAKVTYTITYMVDGVEKQKELSTNDAAEELVFENLPAGNYTLKAVGLSAEDLTPYSDQVAVTLKTVSPDMNIIQDTQATRPSFNGCSTGYLAFRFQQDNRYSDGISIPFNDDYEFTITEAPSGVSVPIRFKPLHLTDISGYLEAITPFRNLPAGAYKVKIENHCKTLLLDCNITSIANPNNLFWLGGCFYYPYDYNASSNLYISYDKSKYYFNYSPLRGILSSVQSIAGNRLLWDDIITVDYHDTFGHEMKNVPFTGERKELTVRPWGIDKITIKFKCSSIPAQVITGTIKPCATPSTTYCGLPTVDANRLVNPNMPETITLVVNEMNGTVIGNQVLRQVKPTGVYHLGNNRKTYMIRLYTADNILLYQSQIVPIPAPNARMFLSSPISQNCKTSRIRIRLSEEVNTCYGPYILKVYTGDGTHTLLEELLYPHISSTGETELPANYTPNTKYDFELYTAEGTLLDSKSIQLPPAATVTLPNFYFGNTCDNRYTNTVVQSFTQNGKQLSKMFYQLNYLYFNTPLPSNQYDGYSTLTVVKDGITYKSDIRGNGGLQKLSWTIVQNGLTYSSQGPTFDWGETINGTLTVPDCGFSIPITGKAEKRETNFRDTKLENMTMVQTCTGWDVTPGGHISYTNLDGSRTTIICKEYRLGGGPWKNVNVPFALGKLSKFRLTLRGDNMCDIVVEAGPFTYKPHDVNRFETVAYSCGGINKGKIYVAAQDGVPPYKYQLLNGENESDPVVQTKEENGPVMFEYGDVGKKYRVHIYDKCGSLRIHYITAVLSTADLGISLSRTQRLCVGSNLKLVMQNFPSATYAWTLPDGTHQSNRILDLGPATRTKAGVYHVVITLPDCTTPINATITVVVDDIGAPSWTPAVQTICQGTTATLSPGAAQSYTDNTPGTPKYQWQRRDPYGSNFSDIDGATMADYNFQADTPGAYTFRRVTTYKGCEHTSDEAKVVVTPGPIQTLSPAELERTVRKGSTGYTLTGGSLQTNGTTIASYKWERSTDGSTWTTVGTTANYKETQKFKLEKVYYRRTVTPTVGTCVHTTPTITVNFKKMRTAYVNPHIRTRVKSE